MPKPTFVKKYKSNGTYRAPAKGEDYELGLYTEEEIAEWAKDPLCVDSQRCVEYLERKAKWREQNAGEVEKKRIAAEERATAEANRLAMRRELLDTNPFDPRTEVSEDAKHIAGRIVTALWIIFVLIPIVAVILFEILK